MSTLPYLVETLTAAAQFLKYDARTKSFMSCDAPEKVAETYLAREGSWRLQTLTGVCNAPFLRVDGSICEQPDYDAASGMLFKPEGERFASIPQHPSKADAAAALQTVESLIETFPFVAPPCRHRVVAAADQR